MGQFALGQAVPRTEDPRLLRGRGKYVDDIALPYLCHACVLRSPHAHARIVGIDTSAARTMPCVLAILTGEDWGKEKSAHTPPIFPRPRRDGSPLFVQPRPALAWQRAVLVCDPVAFVVAETVAQAKDAAEAI